MTIYKIKHFYWKYIKTIWNPQHSKIRKAIPRYWMDVDVIFEDVCFEIIKSFYEDEYKLGLVDWEGSGGRSMEFVKWLEKTYKYVTCDRVALQQQIDETYPDWRKVVKLEAKLEKKDTEVFTDLVKWRKYMWT